MQPVGQSSIVVDCCDIQIFECLCPVDCYALGWNTNLLGRGHDAPEDALDPKRTTARLVNTGNIWRGKDPAWSG